jgi:hypothetical protein
MVACIDFFEMSEICRPKFIVRHSTVAAINLETPGFFYCKLLLRYQFLLRQSVECAQR